MKFTKKVMGMTAIIDIVEKKIKKGDVEKVFAYFKYMDDKFSTYKNDSEIVKINRGYIENDNYSEDMKKILNLAEKTKKDTRGYFDIKKNGRLDPSGIVKGYAIYEAAKMLRKLGYKNFYVEIAGDIEVAGKNHDGKEWKVGIQNPFNVREIVKVIGLSDCGIATSGSYIRGTHIYDPLSKKNADQIASMTVVAQNVYDADRFATAAFAMGERGINFIESLRSAEGYMIKKDKRAVFTSGFSSYLIN